MSGPMRCPGCLNVWRIENGFFSAKLAETRHQPCPKAAAPVASYVPGGGALAALPMYPASCRSWTAR